MQGWGSAILLKWGWQASTLLLPNRCTQDLLDIIPEESVVQGQSGYNAS
jgi:hypothetical protein